MSYPQIDELCSALILIRKLTHGITVEKEHSISFRVIVVRQEERMAAIQILPNLKYKMNHVAYLGYPPLNKRIQRLNY